jgi:hypothetical protein
MHGKIKSSPPPKADKAGKTYGLRRTYSYAATTKVKHNPSEAGRWTFYEAINIDMQEW